MCSPQYCLCVSTGDFVLDCGDNEGWCPDAGACIPDCVDSCGQDDYCGQLCMNAEDYEEHGEMCSSQYCLCVSTGDFVLDCGDDEFWCPNLEKCIQDCRVNCQ